MSHGRRPHQKDMTLAHKGVSLVKKVGATCDAKGVCGRIGDSGRGEEFGAAPTTPFSGSRSQPCRAGLTSGGGPPGHPGVAKGPELANMKHYNIEVNWLTASMVPG